MRGRTPEDVASALRLLACERGTTGSSVERAAAALRVHERLAERLGPLIGAAGAQALFLRSLRLTAMEIPCLSEVIDVDLDPTARAPATASTERLLSSLSALEPAATSAAAAALFGTLIGLLGAFIGERLVWQVLRGAFAGIDESAPEETK